MNVKLLGDKVLIKAEAGEKTTQSGLILAKVDEMGDLMTGTVVSVGPGRYDNGVFVNTTVSVDQKVIFQYGKPILVGGEQYLLVIESDIIMVL